MKETHIADENGMESLQLTFRTSLLFPAAWPDSNRAVLSLNERTSSDGDLLRDFAEKKFMLLDD